MRDEMWWDMRDKMRWDMKDKTTGVKIKSRSRK